MVKPGAVVLSSKRAPSERSSGTKSSAPDSRKTSDSSASLYSGKPLSVLRVTWGRLSDQPKPKGPLPEPESYASESWGPNPERPGLAAMGTDMEPVPVTGLAANFSPMPRMAPPPLGREMEGAARFCSPSGRPDAFSAEAIADHLASEADLPVHGWGRHLSSEPMTKMNASPGCREVRSFGLAGFRSRSFDVRVECPS